MDAIRCRQLLAACLPRLSVADLRYLAEGWDSTVFLVNESLIFRFPKRAEVADWLEQELRLLPELGPSLPAAIPDFQYRVYRGPSAPFTFAGYPLIEGIPVDRIDLTPAARETLAADAGRFLRALHDFPVERARALGVRPASTAGGRAQVEAFAATVRERILPLLAPDEAVGVTAWFEAAPDRGLFAFIPALVHDDLGPEHILADPATGRLTGVIDFGDCGIGDPAIDFAGVLIGLGERAVRTALGAYGSSADTALLTRARMYRQLAPLHEVLYGLEIGGREHVARGLAGLRERMLASA